MDHNIYTTILRCTQTALIQLERYARSTWKVGPTQDPVVIEGRNTGVPPRKTTRTGYFDLPLELRQTVYGYILPSDRTIRFPLRRLEEKTVIAVRASHELLHKEMETWMYRECGALLAITPDKEMNADELPIELQWHRFRRLDIYINRYQNPKNHSLSPGDAALRQAIASLRYGHPNMLPTPTISFMEDTPLRIGDRERTEEVPEGRTSRWHGMCDELYMDEYDYKEPPERNFTYRHSEDSDTGSDSDAEDSLITTTHIQRLGSIHPTMPKNQS